MKTISLTQGQAAMVDDEDFESLSVFRWHAKKPPNYNPPQFMAVRNVYAGKRGITIYMHRAIMGVTDPKIQIDHKNHDTLDNRRENLRVTDARGNHGNLKRKAKMSSRFTGVYWKKQSGKWYAQININGNVKYLGLFVDETAAGAAYRAAVAALAEPCEADGVSFCDMHATPYQEALLPAEAPQKII